MIYSRYRNIKAYNTKDGSEIRELMHPNSHGNQNQSLAEARIQIDQQTVLHQHLSSEELYFIIQGSGLMQLADQQLTVKKGDTVCIPPNTPHNITNTGTEELVILCCCSPAYSHDDTQLITE